MLQLRPEMGFTTTQPAPAKTRPAPKNRVRRNFSAHPKTRPAKAARTQQPRRKTHPAPPETVSGVRYYKYRHYAPKLGRWLGRDPIEEEGGINLYAFVGNEPIVIFDYLGLEEALRISCSEWFEVVDYSKPFLHERKIYHKRLGEWRQVRVPLSLPHRTGGSISQLWRAKYGRFKRTYIKYKITEEWRICFCYKEFVLQWQRRETRPPTRVFTDPVKDGEDLHLNSYNNTKDIIYRYGMEGPAGATTNDELPADFFWE